jgi:multicomponent Na+:H+ antiporter subunit G
MAASVLHLLQSGVGAVLIATGLAFMLAGAVGALRFPDFYTRLHAVRVSDGLGAVVLIAGLAVIAEDWRIALRLALLATLLVALGPTLAHIAASAAHAAGLAPLAGSYTAPRPDARRRGAPR